MSTRIVSILRVLVSALRIVIHVNQCSHLWSFFGDRIVNKVSGCEQLIISICFLQYFYIDLSTCGDIWEYRYISNDNTHYWPLVLQFLNNLIVTILVKLKLFGWLIYLVSSQSVIFNLSNFDSPAIQSMFTIGNIKILCESNTVLVVLTILLICVKLFQVYIDLVSIHGIVKVA